MGILSKVKGFLNIGGVSVRVTQVENPFPEEDTVMKGKFVLTTKSKQTILGTKVEFYRETTTGEGDEEQTSRSTLGQQDTQDYLYTEEYPFELDEDETRELSFLIIDVHTGGFTGRAADKGGVIGAAGKLGALAGKLTADADARVKYYVEVTADVEGTPFDPSDKVEIQVVPGKS